MKNKYASKITEQMLADIRRAEENVQRLADDQTRIEFQLMKLWEYVGSNLGLAVGKSPAEFHVECSFCSVPTTQYNVERLEGTSYYEVKCKSCLIKEERERVENED